MNIESAIGSAVYQGKRHELSGVPCRDRSIAMEIGDLVVLALSDGMGSCIHSDIGADFATGYTIKNAKALYDSLFVGHYGRNAFDRSYENIVADFYHELATESLEFAHNIGVKPVDLSCTLSFAIIGPEWTILASVGDSPVYIQTDRCQLEYFRGNEGMGSHEAYNALSLADAGRAASKAVISSSVDTILITSDSCKDTLKDDTARNKFSKESWALITEGGRFRLNLKRILKARSDSDISYTYFVSNISTFMEDNK